MKLDLLQLQLQNEISSFEALAKHLGATNKRTNLDKIINNLFIILSGDRFFLNSYEENLSALSEEKKLFLSRYKKTEGIEAPFEALCGIEALCIRIANHPDVTFQ